MAKSDDSVSTTTPLDVLTVATDEQRRQLDEWCREVVANRAIAKSFDALADDVFDNKIAPLLRELKLSSSVAAPAWSLVYSRGRKTLKPDVLLRQSWPCLKCKTLQSLPMAALEAAKEAGASSWSVRGKDEPPANEKAVSETPQ